MDPLDPALEQQSLNFNTPSTGKNAFRGCDRKLKMDMLEIDTQ